MTAQCMDWHVLHAGMDYPREIDWLEVKRVWGGGVAVVGMNEDRRQARN